MMSLRDYRRKRDFTKTDEPTGGKRGKRLAYVVQKHAASHLHYDFRLEFGGVLWSWAVPKGPCLDPAEKRLAVQVEDHPLDYRTFEGTIPEGQYGGGTVMVWDQGEWEPQGNPESDRRAGRLHLNVKGIKLRGGWALVRMRARAGRSKPEWLLIKSRDKEARSLRQTDILEEKPESVVTGRTLEEIAAGQVPRRKSPATTRKRVAPHPHKSRPSDARTGSRREPRAPKSKQAMSRKASRAHPNGKRARPIPSPDNLGVQLATLVEHAPSGKNWLHEFKFDGYRMLCRIDDTNVEFISRNGKSWTARFDELLAPAARLPVKNAILDGEVVVLDEHGVSNFQALQNALGEQPGNSRLTYFVFDLLFLNGADLRDLPLHERRSKLASLLKKLPSKSAAIRLSEHIEGSGSEVEREACRAGLEGIVSKRVDAPYRAGRGTDWVKSKCRQGQEFVIGGYTSPERSREAFGALLLGYHRADGHLAYAGKVGTGFARQTLRTLITRFKALEQKRNPFTDLPRGVSSRGVHWLDPRLVAQVEFSNWTKDGLLRQAAFQGLRDDKPAKAVIRERAAAPASNHRSHRQKKS